MSAGIGTGDFAFATRVAIILKSRIGLYLSQRECSRNGNAGMRELELSASMANPFFTIGHSTRLIDSFVDLLKGAEIGLVVDVRTVPRSRTNPQYNSDVFSASLSAFQIGYEHIASLGGLRGKQRDVPAAVNAFWENQSFHNFADYAMGAEFHSGLGRL